MDVCKDLFHYFVDEVESIRSLIPDSTFDRSVSVSCLPVFDQFEPISLPFLENVVGHMKPTGSPVDPIPASFLKNVLPSGASVLAVINSTMTTSIVPDVLKHAVVNPLTQPFSLFKHQANLQTPLCFYLKALSH